MGVPVLWKDIAGYEGLYKISNQGDIFSLQSNRLLKPHVCKSTGYAYVSLCRSSRDHHYCTIHRLVAKHFVGGYVNGLCVNHKNEIKTDNRAENLEWVTKQYNNTYNDKVIKSSAKTVMQYSLDGRCIKAWTSAREASRVLGVQWKNISAVCRGKRKSAGGYCWKFKEVS